MKLLLSLAIAIAIAMIMPAWAEDASVGLSKRMMCYVQSTLTGNIGLLLGFILAIYGLYLIIMQGSVTWGIITILLGASVTALPPLIANTLSGGQQVLEGSGVSREANRDVYSTYMETFSHKDDCESIPVDMSSYLQSQGKAPGYGSYYPPVGSPSGTVGGTGGQRGLVPGQFGYDQMGGCNKNSGVASGVASGTLTSCYGVDRGSHKHGGVDIAGSIGQPIGAYKDGTVIYADYSNGYGNHVLVKHTDGTITSYGHLNGFNVKVGDTVSSGQQIGQMGNTGRSTGPHLDFEYRDANNNKLNPCVHTNVCGK